MKSAGGGPALLFERPTLVNGQPSAFPVAINLFGSMRRTAIAFGVKQLDDIGARIEEVHRTRPREGIVASLAILPRMREVSKFPPRKRSGDSPSQEVVWRGAEVDIV